MTMIMMTIAMIMIIRSNIVMIIIVVAVIIVTGDSSMVERRTRDRKVSGSSPGRSGGYSWTHMQPTYMASNKGIL